MVYSLTGFMGCGKSSTGRILAGKLGLPFIDLDEAIEKIEGRSICEIFAAEGEEGFRSVELKTLRGVLASAPERGLVLALGGGTVTTDDARELILSQTECIWLKTDIEKIIRNIGSHTESRPLFKDREKAEALYKKREPYYNMAHLCIDMSGKNPERAAEEILLQLADKASR